MAITYLSIGSNLGDREFYLRQAVADLSRRGVEVVRRAGFYETQPRDAVDQPWFLNTAIEGKTDLTPQALLETCLEVERCNHRIRETPKGPRTLDIDILFYEDRIVDQPGLSIPHPRIIERRFVLVPLNEIAPNWKDPLSGKTVRRLLEECGDQSEVRPLH